MTRPKMLKMTIESLAQNLIDMAIADEAADTADKEEELLALSRVVVPPINKKAGRRTHTQISLTSLFDFSRSDNGLYFYWQGFECRG